MKVCSCTRLKDSQREMEVDYLQRYTGSCKHITVRNMLLSIGANTLTPS